jgi:hypothetical protein
MPNKGLRKYVTGFALVIFGVRTWRKQDVPTVTGQPSPIEYVISFQDHIATVTN